MYHSTTSSELVESADVELWIWRTDCKTKHEYSIAWELVTLNPTLFKDQQYIHSLYFTWKMRLREITALSQYIKSVAQNTQSDLEIGR